MGERAVLEALADADPGDYGGVAQVSAVGPANEPDQNHPNLPCAVPVAGPITVNVATESERETPGKRGNQKAPEFQLVLRP